MSEKEQLYCITARRRSDKKTVVVLGPMHKATAEKFTPNGSFRDRYKYFRVSKFPFKEHFKR